MARFPDSSWWRSNVEPTASVQEVAFVDPDRSVATYNAMLGGSESLEAFMLEARQQSRADWRNEYTATNVSQYIRMGFALQNP